MQKAGKETMKVNRLRSLFIEVYKSINKIFKLRKTSKAVRSNYKFRCANY